MRCQEHYYNPPAQPDEITCDVCLREACDHYTPTEAEEQIVKLRARIRELEARLAEVRALHRETSRNLCFICGYSWPCWTYKAAEVKP